MTTLITGGTGKTGRRVAQRLTTTGRAVKLGSRSGDVRFDWDDELTWAPALDGCASAYITFAPDIAFPGAADTVARVRQDRARGRHHAGSSCSPAAASPAPSSPSRG